MRRFETKFVGNIFNNCDTIKGNESHVGNVQ